MNDPSPATILVVDDMNTSSLEKMLVADGYRVLTAESGPAALNLLEAETVDLVLLDIVMPGMDGYEVLGRIRAQHGDHVPVLLASGRYTDSGDVAHGLQVGADDYIFKPFDFSELRARIVAKINQQRLASELRLARQEAEAQNALLRRVLGIVQSTTRSMDPDTLAATIYRGLHQELGVDRAAVWRFDTNHQPYALPADARPISKASWEALRAGAPLVREASRVLVPIRIVETLEGVLDMEWSPHWPEGAATILQALSDSLAILFQNSRYVRQIARENTFHEILNELASRDAELPDMLAQLRQFLNTHLLLCNRWFNLLVSDTVPEFVEDGQLRPRIIEYYQAQGLFDQIQRRRRPIVVEGHGAIPYHRIFPVVLGGEVTALLITLPIDGNRATLAPTGELERAARFLAGVLQRWRESDLREQHTRADFLNSLLSTRMGEEVSRTDLFLRANALGLNLSQPAFVARIELPGFNELVDWAQPFFEQRIGHLLSPLLRDSQAAREALNLEGIEVAIGESVVVIISMAATVTEEQARNKARLWAQKVLESFRHRERTAKHQPAIGLGRLAANWREFPRSANEAERALRWVLSNAKATVAYYGDLGSERLLAAIPDREELARFHDEQLQPIVTYDAEREGDLIHTLQVFFANGGQIARAAQVLSIHPNTLKYRLDQVTQLTGRNPRDPNVALDLQLALKIHGML